ncbi:MAG: 1-acyl-sn-glycerol-3-phosphate acyltransferase [Lachnospiraceae bacterium]|nr:1-acyl-sn-glycerol-3-phosphate acyltransferase [Lachnospiraceae bacterium]
MIRFLIACITVIGFLILSIPVMLVEWIVGKFSPNLKDRRSLKIVNCVFSLILWEAGTKITVLGEENVPKDTAVLYVANHRSFFDILVTYVRVPRPTGYISKKELEKVPLLNVWMRYLNCLFMDRTDIKKGLQTILEGVEKLKNGISICIFPEGTRNTGEEGTVLNFKEGSFKMATKSGCPIIPVAISNTIEIWEAHMPFIRKTHVIIEYGKPINSKELPKEEQKFIGAYCQKQIETMLNKNKDLI